ncbi:MAG: type VI secretion system contractile sheath small subunit, partial [Desulfosporosinus sp.]|nr:type VI secretion system contractile sheath small subunit [Desulfosporosinus sp.]
VALNFKSLKDFGPEAIVKNTPELNRLLELRNALGVLKGPLSNIPEFRKQILELVKDEASHDQLLKELGIEK